MCGIAGIINTQGQVSPKKLQAMCNVIKHRGPDDEGYFLYSNLSGSCFVSGEDTFIKAKTNPANAIDRLDQSSYILGFGHRRLSIIDISEQGHQPMSFSGITITYNGEIYNYIELREELIRRGFVFETDGDTEVIVKAYMCWGEDCVKRFNGMWAFAIFDSAKKRVFCSRDRIGVKPFYYYKTDTEFIFGSEIKQILASGVKPSVNEKILFVFLTYSMQDYCNETFFENIFTLDPGHSICFDLQADDRIAIEDTVYWDLQRTDKYLHLSFEESAEAIGKALEESIRLRLRSDVEVGSCLSGGLDSSSIVALVCKLLPYGSGEEFKTFSAVYDDHIKVDERRFSRMVAESVGCKNYEVKPLSKKIITDFEKLVWHQDEPFGGLSIFAGWCVMEKASQEGVVVLLDGQGGDETLLGYEKLFAYFLREPISQFKIKTFRKSFKEIRKNSNMNFRKLMEYFVYFSSKTIRKKYLLNKISKFGNADFISRFAKQNLVDELIDIKDVQTAQTYEIKNFILNLLKFEDRNSMAHSIESRVPFLDYHFVELAYNIRDEYKIREGRSKALLRYYMKEKMPTEVAYRKDKLGFSVPANAWVDEISDHYKTTLLQNPRSSRYFDIEYLKKAFAEKIDHKARYMFIVVETWMRVYEIE